MARKVLIAFPPSMHDEMEQIAATEHRTKSDLVREAIRRYIQEFRKNFMVSGK